MSPFPQSVLAGLAWPGCNNSKVAALQGSSRRVQRNGWLSQGQNAPGWTSLPRWTEIIIIIYLPDAKLFFYKKN